MAINPVKKGEFSTAPPSDQNGLLVDGLNRVSCYLPIETIDKLNSLLGLDDHWL